MGDLLRQLTDVDVDLLTAGTVVSCPSELARRVTSRPARRRLLDVYVNNRNGSVSVAIYTGRSNIQDLFTAGASLYSLRSDRMLLKDISISLTN